MRTVSCEKDANLRIYSLDSEMWKDDDWSEISRSSLQYSRNKYRNVEVDVKT